MDPGVTEYINSVEQPWQQAIMKRLRKLMHEVDPNTEEKLKWGSPAFDHSGPVLWMFSAQKWVHISFPHGSLLDASHGLFVPTENRAQRTIKLKKNDQFPEKTLAVLIRQVVENNVKGKKISFAASKPGSRKYGLPKKYEKLLSEKNLLHEFKKRPYYQQSGWIRWIVSAKQDSTKKRRLRQMFGELKAGNVYMKMPW